MRTGRQRRGGEEEVEGGMTHQTAITRETVHARVARYSFWGVFLQYNGVFTPNSGLGFLPMHCGNRDISKWIIRRVITGPPHKKGEK